VCLVSYPLVLAVPQSDDQIVHTDYMDATPDRGNLARIRNDGTEAWRVTPTTHSQDAWTVAWTGSQAETQSLLDKITNYTSHAQNGGLPVADAAWQIVIDSYTGPPPGACLSALREMAESLRRIGSDLRLHELAPPQRAGEPPTTVRESSL
jgi:hypothetical protein